MSTLQRVLDLLARYSPGLTADPDRLFIDHDIDSAESVEITAALQDDLGRPLPSTVLYDHPTPRLLAGHLDRLAGGASHPSRAAPAVARAEEPVAIVGIGCRLPGANGPERLWDMLARGGSGVGPIPAARARHQTGWAETGVGLGGFLPDITGFDAGFFGINAREAAAMDPQQRMLLEVAYEAVQDAGVRRADLAGSQTGVFIGISNGDFVLQSFGEGAGIDGYAPTGSAYSIAANRISYAFDLHGPSMAIDTACSSSLVCVHQAVMALRAGQCDAALAGGVNALLNPHVGQCFRAAGVLAPDGRCKSFGAGADGMGRSEGAVVLVLRRLADALADHDRVYALVRGGAVNNDGLTNGLMSPSAPAQVRLLRAACAAAGVAPGEIGYVEGHGSGTELGDLMELRALTEVLGRAEDRVAPLRVGSIKSNVSHLEAAAGAAGVAKVSLALFHGTLPMTCHASPPAADFDWAGSGLCVQEKTEPWTGRLAGVSSFGFGGTNAHLVLEAPPRWPRRADGHERYYLPVSAPTSMSLRGLAERWRTRLSGTEADAAGTCHTAGIRRDHHRYRLAVSGTPAELGDALDRALTALVASPPVPSEPGGLAVAFTEEDPEPADTWAVDVATSLSRAGVRPEVVIGFGAAEVIAAQYTGVLTARDAEIVTELRRKLLSTMDDMEALRIRLEHRVAQALCDRLGPDLAVSVVEDERTCVLVGPSAALDRVRTALARTDVRWTDAGSAVPDHSGLAAPVADDLVTSLAGLATNVGEIPVVSTLTGRPVDGRTQGAAYWARLLSAPSLLGDAIGHATSEGVGTIVEIGPSRIGPLLRTTGGRTRVVRCATAMDGPAVLTRLYELGHDLDWRTLNPPADVVSLPSFPWARPEMTT